MSKINFYTSREEKANYLTHAFGVIMAMIASFLFYKKIMNTGADARTIFAYTTFSFGMLACMLSSTIYHFEKDSEKKAKLRHFDHASIYLLIASSYTPFTFILLREEKFWGWLLFILVWVIAVIGIITSFGQLKRNSHLKTFSYVLMGLIVLIAFKPLIDTARAKDCMDVIFWLIAGGVFYIIGAVIYATCKKEFIHAVFHIFVLLGLASHILSAYLIPI